MAEIDNSCCPASETRCRAGEEAIDFGVLQKASLVNIGV